MTEVDIVRIGAQGDGIAELADGPVYVPYAAPGDRVRLARADDGRKRRTAEIAELVTAGPARIEPACRHFGTCGGCALQHLSAAYLATWKRQRILDALSGRGLVDVPVAETIGVGSGSRRRLRLAARRTQAGVILGFNARQSHQIVDIAECPVAEPALAALLPALRTLLAALLPKGGKTDVQLTLCDNGIDLWLTEIDGDAMAAQRQLATFAEAQDLARISAGGERLPVIERRRPLVQLSGIAVPLPPGGFLQASRAGEQALVGQVLAATAGARRVADLYAGLGTFSFALARNARVHAVEGDAAAVASMTAGRNGASGLKQIQIEHRDLGRRPLAGRELKPYDAVVFDPPRTGAREQAEALAASAVETVVAVSCEPASFARDARILVDGGYRLEGVLPVDQFTWSAHVELVACFARGGGRRQIGS